MRTFALALVAATATTAMVAQQSALDRLPTDQLDVVPPSGRVSGALGSLTVRETSCRSLPGGRVRRRIVDVAVQEWAPFGFTVVDQTRVDQIGPSGVVAVVGRF